MASGYALQRRIDKTPRHGRYRGTESERGKEAEGAELEGRELERQRAKEMKKVQRYSVTSLRIWLQAKLFKLRPDKTPRHGFLTFEFRVS